MLKAALAAALAGLMLATGAVFATPGPNGNNDRGLCRAYFAGSGNGQSHERGAGTFVALEDAAGCQTDSQGNRSCDCTDPNGDGSPDTAAECVAAFCGRR